MPEEPEKSIECRAIVAIASRGVFVVKHTVEACYRCHARPNQRTGLGPGASDLFCLVDGRACFIEMKRKGYSPSDVSADQRRWLEMVRRYGAISGVADSVEGALALVEEARGKS